MPRPATGKIALQTGFMMRSDQMTGCDEGSWNVAAFIRRGSWKIPASMSPDAHAFVSVLIVPQPYPVPIGFYYVAELREAGMAGR